jgi:3-hydroxyisobutyrate dehydrogenase
MSCEASQSLVSPKVKRNQANLVFFLREETTTRWIDPTGQADSGNLIRTDRGKPISNRLTVSRDSTGKSRQLRDKSYLLNWLSFWPPTSYTDDPLWSRNGTARAAYRSGLKSKIAAGKRRYVMKPITQENSRLGLVGIGYMGRPIARRLLESGFRLTTYDRDRAKTEGLRQYGGTIAHSVSELCSSCNIVLSCLPSDEAVLDTYKGPDGVLAHAHRGSVVIDMSTVYPATSQELSRLGSQFGVEVLDVTISGSTPAAEHGLLTLFGGGDKEHFDAAESIFRVIAKKYFYLGLSGSGATMKLVVNALLGIGMQAIAEAVALGEKAGLDRNRLLEVLSQTAVVAPAHVGKLERAMKSDYSPQFPIRLMNKDFGLILALASTVGARMPAAGAAFEINARQSDEGAEQDFSAVILQMEKRARLDSNNDGRV